MQINSHLPLRGELAIYLRHADGSKELHFEDKNLIVYAGRTLVLQALYLASYTPDPVATLRVGDGGCIDPAGLYPKTPSTELTSLYHQILSIPTTYQVVNPSIPSVTFLASVDQGQCNGTLLSEAGLFTGTGLMFNIKTFTGIPKTSYFAVDFVWTISVA